jgi:hypothetical protein
VKGRDGRSLRIAIVSDDIINAQPGSEADRLLLGLHAQGWGIVALPPATLPDEPARAWLDTIADQVGEFARHGLGQVVLFAAADAPARRRLALERLGDAAGATPETFHGVETLVDAVLPHLAWRAESFTAEPPSWTSAARARAAAAI